jgi:hypothetical protein
MCDVGVQYTLRARAPSCVRPTAIRRSIRPVMYKFYSPYLLPTVCGSLQHRYLLRVSRVCTTLPFIHPCPWTLVPGVGLWLR